jgi:hypothetical protein
VQGTEARIEHTQNAYKILVEDPERRDHFGGPRRKRKEMLRVS